MDIDINSLTENDLIALSDRINLALKNKKERDRIEEEQKNNIFHQCIKNNYIWVTNDWREIPLYDVTDNHWKNIKKKFKPEKNKYSLKDYLDCDNYRREMIPIKAKEREIKREKRKIQKEERKRRINVLKDILFIFFHNYMPDIDIKKYFDEYINHIASKCSAGDKYLVIDDEKFDLDNLINKLKLYNHIKNFKTFNLNNYVKLFGCHKNICLLNENDTCIDDYINRKLSNEVDKFDEYMNENYYDYHEKSWDILEENFNSVYKKMQKELPKQLEIIKDTRCIYDHKTGTILTDFYFFENVY